MKLTRKLVIAGALFGIIPIVLGIVALTTQPWINLNWDTNITSITVNTFGLFSCKNETVLCNTISGFTLTQGLLLAGVSAIAAGVIIAVLLEIIFKNRTIQLLPLFFLFAGPTLILIGLLLYAKYLFEELSTAQSPVKLTLALTYSIILMIVACIVGFLTAIYFAVVAGFGMHRHHRHNPNAPMVITQYSERF